MRVYLKSFILALSLVGALIVDSVMFSHTSSASQDLSQYTSSQPH